MSLQREQSPGDSAAASLRPARVLLIAEEAVIQSWRGFREGARRKVESTVRWAGPAFQSREPSQIVSTVLVPSQTVSGGFFEIPHDATRAMGAALGAFNLVNLAQIHTHPGRLVGHSGWDDRHSYSTREGAISIIWPHYGRDLPAFSDWGVHERRNSKWVRLDQRAAEARIMIVPSFLDLRIVMEEAAMQDGDVDLNGYSGHRDDRK